MNELMQFHLLRPWWLLGLIPLAIIVWRLWHQRNVAQNWNAICDAHLLPHLLTEQTIRQRSRWPL